KAGALREAGLSGDAGVSDYGPAGRSFLQSISRVRAAQFISERVSIRSIPDGAHPAPFVRAFSNNRSAERHALVAYGVGSAGVVVFARAFPHRAGDRVRFPGPHGVRHAGHGRALVR